MCCLTIYKTYDNKLVITHNRDEQISRQLSSHEIITEIINGGKVWMPKDQPSNGTWVATNGELTGCILNGYEVNHIKKARYKESRGTIIPTLFQKKSVDKFIQEFDPTGYEPFTLIIHEAEHLLIEYGWDEKEIHTKILDINTPHLYSSSTLYSVEIRSNRKSLFEKYLHQETDANDIWKFHHNKGDDHSKFINVDYNEEISTVAISQIVLDNVPVFHYQSFSKSHNSQSVILI